MSLAPWAGSLEERAVEVQCNQRFFTLNQPSDKHTTIATLYTLFRPVWHTSSHTRPRLPACSCASSARVTVSGDVACVTTEREDVLISSTLRLFCMPSLPTGLHAGSCAQSPPFGAVSATTVPETRTNHAESLLGRSAFSFAFSSHPGNEASQRDVYFQGTDTSWAGAKITTIVSIPFLGSFPSLTTVWLMRVSY